MISPERSSFSSQVLTNAEASFGDRMLHLSILHAAGRTNFQGFLKETQQKALAASGLRWRTGGLAQPVWVRLRSAGLAPGTAPPGLQPGVDSAGAGRFLRGAAAMERTGDLSRGGAMDGPGSHPDCHAGARDQEPDGHSRLGVCLGPGGPPGLRRADSVEYAGANGLELGLGAGSRAGALARGGQVSEAVLAADRAPEPLYCPAGYRRPAARVSGLDAARPKG